MRYETGDGRTVHSGTRIKETADARSMVYSRGHLHHVGGTDSAAMLPPPPPTETAVGSGIMICAKYQQHVALRTKRQTSCSTAQCWFSRLLCGTRQLLHRQEGCVRVRVCASCVSEGSIRIAPPVQREHHVQLSTIRRHCPRASPISYATRATNTRRPSKIGTTI